MTIPYRVLFLCTGNSARSIMAEAILNFRGRPQFEAFSAGSHPTRTVRPEALHELEAAGIPTTGLRSKGWEEFGRTGAPRMDFVFTVCDRAAREVCPIWPGQPITANWRIPEPAAPQGSAETVQQSFREAFLLLEERILLFLALPIASLDRLSLKHQVGQLDRAVS